MTKLNSESANITATGLYRSLNRRWVMYPHMHANAEKLNTR